MTLRDLLAVVEIRTKVVSVTTFALGTLYAAWVTASFSATRAALLFAAVLCVDMGTTALNSFFDYRRRVDEPERNREEDKVLVHRGVAPGAALLVGLGLFGLASLLGVVLAVLSGPFVLLVGLAGMVVGYRYNGGRLPISHTPFGELFAGLFLGPILFLLCFAVQARTVTPGAVLISAPLGLLVASILTVNNTCDIDGDRAAGRRTLSILVGRRGGELLVSVLGGTALAVTALAVALGALPLVAAPPLAAVAGIAIATWRGMHRRGFSHATKGPNMRAIARLLGLYGAALCLSLVGAMAIPALRSAPRPL